MFAFKKRMALALGVLLTSQMGTAFALVPIDANSLVVQRIINRARAYAKAGRNQEAETLYRSAYRTSVAYKLPESPQAIQIFEGLRELSKKDKKYANAVEFAQRIVEADKKLKGEHHILVADDQMKVADLQFDSGKFEDARQSYADAIATANGASSAGYASGTVSPAARLIAKKDLLFACYDGMAKCIDKIDDISTVEDTYRSTILQLAKIKDPEFPKDAIRDVLLKKFHAYVQLVQRPDDADDLDREVGELFRRQEANRTYQKSASNYTKQTNKGSDTLMHSW